MNFRTIVASAAFAVVSTVAQAAIVDFETVTTDQFATPLLNIEGYDWDFSASGWFIGPGDTAFHPDGTTNGTSKLVAAGDRAGDTARVVMTQTGGGVFDLGSLDAATANATEVGNRLGIVGSLSGGGTVSTFLDIDGTFDSYALSGFVNLTSVLFFSEDSGSYNFGGFSIDNLNLEAAPVPVPASLPLLLAGLAGLGIMRRRKRS